MSNGTCKIIKFQLTAARRRLGYPRGFQCHHDCFNSQPPEGGWTYICSRNSKCQKFQLTAARRRLEAFAYYKSSNQHKFQLTAARRRLVFLGTFCFMTTGFNSQPPEGGWLHLSAVRGGRGSFNSQPPEGGWGLKLHSGCPYSLFQLTAARRRLGLGFGLFGERGNVSTHSRPKAAG